MRYRKRRWRWLRFVPVPEAPQTIRQNWIPFLTFFFRRIIFYTEIKVSKRGFSPLNEF